MSLEFFLETLNSTNELKRDISLFDMSVFVILRIILRKKTRALTFCYLVFYYLFYYDDDDEEDTTGILVFLRGIYSSSSSSDYSFFCAFVCYLLSNWSILELV